MKIVSVILARGGSKEVPGKNIINLCGRPLISYAIEASLNSLSQETWVSTDCDKIKKISKSCGAMVIDRPHELATDDSKSEHSLLHFIENVSCDIIIFIQPTSPFLKSNHIDKGISMIGPRDSVFSVYKEHWVPRWNSDVSPYNWDFKNRPMRQDVEHKYVENGAFYITTTHLLSRNRLRYSGSMGIVEMSKAESLQIDNHDDLLLAEAVMNYLQVGNNR